MMDISTLPVMALLLIAAGAEKVIAILPCMAEFCIWADIEIEITGADVISVAILHPYISQPKAASRES
jgi:hypothetical protein